MHVWRYTWDEKKAAQNLRAHKIAFEDAVKLFEGPILEQLDERFDYLEERWYAIGLVDGPARDGDLYRSRRADTPDNLRVEG